MLQKSPLFAYIPAKDVARARRFYEEKLGFEPGKELSGGVSYEFASGTACFLYPTPNAGTSAASQSILASLEHRTRGGRARSEGHSRTTECRTRLAASRLPAARRRLGSRIRKATSWPSSKASERMADRGWRVANAPTAVEATSPDRQRAEALYREGVVLLGAKSYAACTSNSLA